MKLFLVIGPHHWRKHERNYQSAVVDKSLDGHLARRLLNSRETIMCEGWLSGVDTGFSVQECHRVQVITNLVLISGRRGMGSFGWKRQRGKFRHDEFPIGRLG